jgi:hypothetical protein
MARLSHHSLTSAIAPNCAQQSSYAVSTARVLAASTRDRAFDVPKPPTSSPTPGRYEPVGDKPWHYASGVFDALTVR